MTASPALNITIQIHASTPAELEHALFMLSNAIGPGRIAGAAYTTPEVSAAVAVTPLAQTPMEEPKAKATRAKKDKAETQPAPEAPEAAPEAPAAEAPAAPATPDVNHVTDKSADEARKEGIKVLQNYFANNPGNMKPLTVLQSKYGVKMFGEIKDDQAHAFLADAMLVAAGNFSEAV